MFPIFYLINTLVFINYMNALPDSFFWRLSSVLHLIHRGNFSNKLYFLFATVLLFVPVQFKFSHYLYTSNKFQFAVNSEHEKFQKYLKAKIKGVISPYRGIKINLFCCCLKYFKAFFLLVPT